MDPEVEDELRGMMSTKVRNDDGSISLDDDVTMAAWNKFHKRWREHSTMAAMVELEVEKKVRRWSASLRAGSTEPAAPSRQHRAGGIEPAAPSWQHRAGSTERGAGGA